MLDNFSTIEADKFLAEATYFIPMFFNIYHISSIWKNLKTYVILKMREGSTGKQFPKFSVMLLYFIHLNVNHIHMFFLDQILRPGLKSYQKPL